MNDHSWPKADARFRSSAKSDPNKYIILLFCPAASLGAATLLNTTPVALTVRRGRAWSDTGPGSADEAP